MNQKNKSLANKETEQVTGGTGEYRESYTTYCPHCGELLEWVSHEYALKRDFFECKNCGRLTYFWQGAKWADGWIYD